MKEVLNEKSRNFNNDTLGIGSVSPPVHVPVPEHWVGLAEKTKHARGNEAGDEWVDRFFLMLWMSLRRTQENSIYQEETYIRVFLERIEITNNHRHIMEFMHYSFACISWNMVFFTSHAFLYFSDSAQGLARDIGSNWDLGGRSKRQQAHGWGSHVRHFLGFEHWLIADSWPTSQYIRGHS